MWWLPATVPTMSVILATLALPNFTQIFNAKSIISSEFWDELASPKRAWFFLRLITERDRRMDFLNVAAWSATGSHLTLCSRTRLKQTPSTVNRQTSPKGPSSLAGNIIMTYMDIKTLKTLRENPLSWLGGEKSMLPSPMKGFTGQGWALGTTAPPAPLQPLWCQREGTNKPKVLLCIRVDQTAPWVWARQGQDGEC